MIGDRHLIATHDENGEVRVSTAIEVDTRGTIEFDDMIVRANETIEFTIPFTLDGDAE